MNQPVQAASEESMASQNQIEANRQNARKSTGPQTAEGKAAVRLNSLKYGLTADTLVLPGEDEDEFEALIESLEAEHAPATPTERMVVRQLAMAAWRLQRLYHVESGFYSLGLADLAEKAQEYRNISDAFRQAMVVERSSRVLDGFSRIEARLERSFYKALHELERLRALRSTTVENKQSVKKQTQLHPQVIEKQPIPIDRPVLQPDPPEPDNIALLP